MYVTFFQNRPIKKLQWNRAKQYTQPFQCVWRYSNTQSQQAGTVQQRTELNLYGTTRRCPPLVRLCTVPARCVYGAAHTARRRALKLK